MPPNGSAQQVKESRQAGSPRGSPHYGLGQLVFDIPGLTDAIIHDGSGQVEHPQPCHTLGLFGLASSSDHAFATVGLGICHPVL